VNQFNADDTWVAMNQWQKRLKFGLQNRLTDSAQKKQIEPEVADLRSKSMSKSKEENNTHRI
jgi:hypothetical protein